MQWLAELKHVTLDRCAQLGISRGMHRPLQHGLSWHNPTLFKSKQLPMELHMSGKGGNHILQPMIKAVAGIPSKSHAHMQLPPSSRVALQSLSLDLLAPWPCSPKPAPDDSYRHTTCRATVISKRLTIAEHLS